MEREELCRETPTLTHLLLLSGAINIKATIVTINNLDFSGNDETLWPNFVLLLLRLLLYISYLTLYTGTPATSHSKLKVYEPLTTVNLV